MSQTFQTPENIEKFKSAKETSGKSNRGDFLSVSFVFRAIIAFVIYASVFFVELTMQTVWIPFLGMLFRMLNLETVFASLSNYNEAAYNAYVGMYIENMLYLMLVVVVVPLFFPEIVDGFRRLKKNAWQLSLIPLIQFGTMIATLIVTILVSAFVTLPNISENQDAINQSLQVSVLGNIFPTVIAAPFVEEIVFRVIIAGGTFMLLTTLFNRKQKKGKKIFFSALGIIVSTLLFGWLHVIRGDYLAVFPYLVMGASMGLTYFLSGRNVAMSIALHMYQNLLATILNSMF